MPVGVDWATLQELETAESASSFRRRMQTNPSKLETRPELRKMAWNPLAPTGGRVNPSLLNASRSADKHE